MVARTGSTTGISTTSATRIASTTSTTSVTSTTRTTSTPILVLLVPLSRAHAPPRGTSTRGPRSTGGAGNPGKQYVVVKTLRKRVTSAANGLVKRWTDKRAESTQR